MFRRYWNAAVVCPGPETEQLAAWCDELDLHIVMGVIERDSGTLYCTTLIFVPGRGIGGQAHQQAYACLGRLPTYVIDLNQR